ncbi:MAG: hypothetical protein AAFN50_00380 [Pseudomonadota bacterium]
MPEITTIGWFHTAMGIVAIVSAVAALINHKEIRLGTRTGEVYLVTTLITAATALTIFQHGGFGPAHGLAVLTLLALVVGVVADKTAVFGAMSRYIRAISYSATLLFHGIPAITDGLMRLPVGDPVVTSIEDPLLRTCYLVLLGAFVVGIALQIRWIRRQPAAQQ